MANDSVNRPQWEAEVTANIAAAGILDDNFPTAALAGATGAVLDPTAGSWEALLAGNACAAGALVFKTAATDTVAAKLRYIPVVSPTIGG